MNSLLLPLGFLACAAAGAALWWWPADTQASASPEVSAPSARGDSKAEAPVLQARWTAPPTVKNPDVEAKRRMVQLPTGEYVQGLNGVIDCGRLAWPSDRPYSPIIGVERSPDGKDWWVHADGSKSISEMVFRSDLGRHDATTLVHNPTPGLPLEPAAMSRAKGEAEAAGKPGAGGVPAGGSATEIKKQ